MFKLKPFYYCCMGAFYSLCAITNAQATQITSAGIIVSKDIKHDVSLPLRYMQGKSNLMTRHYPPTPLKKIVNDLAAPKSESLLIPLTGFQGLGAGLGNYQVTHVRPDPAASVGVAQYVQLVNSDIGIFDKLTGNLAPGFPKPANALWQGFGGACETVYANGHTVKYDQLARRWVISHHAYEDIATGPYYQCVAVSTSEDASGSYHRYAFPIPGSSDYAKLGLWPNAYFMSFMAATPSLVGPVICGLERSKMIDGLTATIQCKQLTNVVSEPLLPIDLDGLQLPPATFPGFFVALNPPNNLLLTKFNIDFADPNNTFLSVVSIPVAAYIKACRPVNGRACAIQPNTPTRLNVSSDRGMSRFVYRQFATYGSMVVNHTVDGPAPKFAPAIRWYELRLLLGDPSLNPVVYQQQTLAPDSKNRFVGSIAIDRFTNLALGYNVTSSLIYPSLELASHNFNDQPNTMTIQPLVTGRGSQINGITDWTTNSMMNVDPVDECTFWFTGEYLKTTGNLNWSTYILKFKLNACR